MASSSSSSSSIVQQILKDGESDGSVQSVPNVSNDEAEPESKLCGICYEEYTSVLRKRIECFKCNKAACTVCIKKYLLTSLEDANCLYCKCHWNRSFLDEYLSKHFREKEYKAHRETILCEREKSKLAETQALYETVMERTNSLNADLKVLTQEEQKLRETLDKLHYEYQDMIRNTRDIIDQKQNQRHYLRRVLNGLTDEVENDESFRTDTINRSRMFVFFCPKDGCNGLLNNKCICEICKTRICKKCHETLTGTDEINETEDLVNNDPVNALQHVCKDENVETIKQIKKDSKSCPGCSAMIHKIDGCEQMWCTLCRTAFDWVSGKKIESGQFHNPHFYAWRRTNGGLAPGAVDANGCPLAGIDINRLDRKVRILTGHYLGEAVWELHREIQEIGDIELPQTRIPLVDPNRQLRISYMKGDISEQIWKAELQKREKRELFSLEKKQVLQMYVTTTNDLFQTIMDAKTLDDLKDMKSQIVSLLHYVYENLRKVNSRYGSVSTVKYAGPELIYDIEKLTPYLVDVADQH